MRRSVCIVKLLCRVVASNAAFLVASCRLAGFFISITIYIHFHVYLFSYSHRNVGEHEVQVLFRVYPGIFLWLELKGMTLPLNYAFVQHMHKEEMMLHPVTLADIDPPIQLFWMYNGGDAATSYQVFEAPFQDYANMNYGHEVFECLNPTGDIGPKSWAPIRLRFSPIEIKEYSVSLCRRIHSTFSMQTFFINSKIQYPGICVDE